MATIKPTVGNVSIPTGTSVEIELNGAGATGYLWNIQADHSKVKVVGHRTAPDTSAFGAAGKETVVIEPVEPGESEVRLYLQAPWDDAPIEEHTIHISAHPG